MSKQNLGQEAISFEENQQVYYRVKVSVFFMLEFFYFLHFNHKPYSCKAVE